LGIPASSSEAALAVSNTPAPTIFRKYDIRGIVDVTLNEGIVEQIGRGFGTTLREREEQRVIVARDARLSSPAYTEALIRGLRGSGIDVTDIGATPTPVANFATHALGIPNAVIVTGSHNPANYNGLKLIVRRAPWHGDRLQALHRRIVAGDFQQGEGGLQQRSVVSRYIDRLASGVTIERPLKVAIDCGNGIAGPVAATLLRRLGCQVHELFCKPDGRFPNHHPNPSEPQNLTTLQQTVIDHHLDIGLALDGDGDRLGVVDASGKIIWPDRQLMLFARQILRERPGSPIVYDVKSTCHLQHFIEAAGGQPLMVASGHSLLRQKMRSVGAPLAGELSGHLFFGDRWYGFDDGLYTAARLLEILAASPRPSDELFAELPDSPCTPEITIPFESEQALESFMEAFAALDRDGEGVTISSIDGLRLEYPQGWGLVRASNTTPSLSLRFEAEDEDSLEAVKASVRRQIHRLLPALPLAF